MLGKNLRLVLKMLKHRMHRTWSAAWEEALRLPEVTQLLWEGPVGTCALQVHDAVLQDRQLGLK